MTAKKRPATGQAAGGLRQGERDVPDPLSPPAYLHPPTIPLHSSGGCGIEQDDPLEAEIQRHRGEGIEGLRAGDDEAARGHFEIVGRLIDMRSAERVVEIERARGLR